MRRAARWMAVVCLVVSVARGSQSTGREERKCRSLEGKMNQYNALKLRVLSMFDSTQVEWLGPNDAARRLHFFPARSAWTYLKRLWALDCLKGVREAEVLWNTELARRDGRVFVGYAHSRISLDQRTWEGCITFPRSVT